MAQDRSPKQRLALAAILFSGVETILAILVEGHPRNISVKLFEIGPLA